MSDPKPEINVYRQDIEDIEVPGLYWCHGWGPANRKTFEMTSNHAFMIGEGEGDTLTGQPSLCGYVEGHPGEIYTIGTFGYCGRCADLARAMMTPTQDDAS